MMKETKKKERVKTQKRSCWVRPEISDRLKEGEFHSEFQQLRKDDSKFYEHFRMSVTSFDELLDNIKSKITGCNTVMRLSVSPAEKLAVTLRYLGSGCSFLELHKSYKLGVSTVGSIVREVCSAIWNSLVKRFMPVPSEESWLRVAENFEKSFNFPHCIGAIDCKHILSLKNASVVLMAVADSKCRLIYVHVAPDEKNSDLTVFERSSLWLNISNKSLNIPPPKTLNNNDDNEGYKIPYVFVGDEAVRFTENILRPYAGKKLNDQKRIFNYRLERARRQVLCTFAILSNKWRIFQRPLNVSENLIIDITKTCCILHNFVLQKEGFIFEDSLTINGFYDINITDPTRGTKYASDVRDHFANYFTNDGAVPWQNSMIK